MKRSILGFLVVLTGLVIAGCPDPAMPALDQVVNLLAIPGVVAPVQGAAPVTTPIDTAQYTGTISWAPADNPFTPTTVYTANIALTAKAGWTLTGVAANSFTVAGATATNAANSGNVAAVFPATGAILGQSITLLAIPGVVVPVRGATPVTTAIDTAQYTGTIAWAPADNPFAATRVYTANIALTAKAGWTLTGVEANSLTVAGATATNALDSGIVVAVFPATGSVTEINVTFNSQGGSFIRSQNVNYGGLVTEPKDPIRTGYTFGGWYKESGFINTWNFGSDAVTADITLYAKWTINQCTVTFDSQGGSSVSSQNVNYDGLVTEPTDPTRTGYAFGRWYKESECTHTWNFGSETVTSNVTLFAKWTINQYTVIFNSQGGSTITSQNVNYSGLVTEPKDPTRTGYTFGGWYKESGCTDAWNFGSDMVTVNVTLFAMWISTYQLLDTGPAGGLIFYINPNSDIDGWRYLEAAPSDQRIQWYNGSSTLTGASGLEIGMGRSNTTIIVTSQGAGSYAAKFCDDLTIGIYSDWFLPSRDELNQMYVNLHGVGGFAAWAYWSSSEYDRYQVWYQHFSNGFQYIDYKSPNFYVRAVRAF